MPGPLRLTRVAFADLPGWDRADPARALAAFRRGCAVLARKPPAAPMGRYGGRVADWLSVCAVAKGDARHFFESHFVPFEISAGRVREGLFTGYYEPLIHASRTRHGAYRTPVYGLPSDLVTADLGRFLPGLRGEHIAGRLDGRRLVPYASRADIDANGLSAARVLFWCDDAVALFFLQIQGSGRVVLDDGTSERIAFAGTNGRPYTAIGRVLIAKGALTRENVSLARIRAWLKAHPADARRVMEADRSFVFFAEAPLGDPALGSPGTLGTALVPGASLAVDARLHPLGAPFYVAAGPVTGLMAALDTGGAIRGPVRGDVFFGFGEKAEAMAGGMKAKGRLYVLLPDALAARIGAQRDFP